MGVFALEGLNKKDDSQLLFCFAVLSVATRIRLISRQSLISDSPSTSVMYSDITSNRSQYSVSAVSLSAICILAIKSALLFPYAASLAFAPMEVPLRMICLEMIVSCFCLIRNCHEITWTEILDKHRIIGIVFREMFNLFFNRASDIGSALWSLPRISVIFQEGYWLAFIVHLLNLKFSE